MFFLISSCAALIVGGVVGVGAVFYEKGQLTSHEGTGYDETLAAVLKAMDQLDSMKLDPDMPVSEVTVECLMDNVWVVGGPDDVEQQLRELYDEVGGFEVLLTMGHEWQPKEQWVNSMTRLAKEVMPRLSDLN